MRDKRKKAASVEALAARMEEALASSLSYSHSTKFPSFLSRAPALLESMCKGGGL